MKKLIMIMLFLPFAALSQELIKSDTIIKENKLSYYAGPGLVINAHTASFERLPGFPNCCNEFTSASGTGIGIYAGASYRINGWFGLDASIGFSSSSADFFEVENKMVNYDNEPFLADIEHTINSGISGFEIKPAVYFVPYENVRLKAGYSLNFGMSGDFEQSEYLASPETKVFSNGSKAQNEYSGDLPGMNSTVSLLSFGGSYSLPVNESGSLLLEPFINYNLALGDLIKDTDWKPNSLALGVVLRFGPASEEIIIENEIFRQDTIVLPGNSRQKIFATGKTEKNIESFTEGNISYINNIATRTDTLFEAAPEEYLEIIPNRAMLKKITGTIPDTKYLLNLIPFVFFAENSSEIPDRFKTKTGNYKNPVGFQRSLLHIIGGRMQEYTESEIALEGFADAKTESGDCSLALARANSVKNYLTENYGIGPERISIKQKPGDCSPGNYTKSTEQAAYDDNRQVRITSNTPEIFAPVEFRAENPYMDDSVSITIRPAMNNPEYVSRWEMTHWIGDEEIGKTSGEEMPSQIEFAQPLYRFLDGSINSYKTVMRYFDENGREILVDKNIFPGIEAPELKTGSIISLLHFEVGMDKIINDYEEIFGSMMEIIPDGEIKIYGFTDRLGEASDNKRLSAKRADKIKLLIEEKYPGFKIQDYGGFASEKYPYGVKSYGTPEERFLSRTVEITVTISQNP
jgi:outer membrane protein OmpA-like peptidoglycan-associated protein